MGSEGSPIGLPEVAVELERLARTLKKLDAGERPQSPAARLALVDVAEELIRLRRRREALFKEDLFGEPAWDVLLDLFVAGARGRRLTVSSVCAGAAVPPTTALRWIKTLAERHMVERTPDARDSRKIYLSLTPGSIETMERVLTATRRSPPDPAPPSPARPL